MVRGLLTAALPVLAAAALAACASTMSRADCEVADWPALGFADGRSGAPAKVSDARLNACAGEGFSVDRAAFAAARQQGLAAYCTGAGGFDAGRLGLDYAGVCPAAAEADFLSGYEAGEKLHILVKAEEDALKSRKAALEALDRHAFLLKAIDKRAASSNIGNEDREAARQEAASRRRDIARLEQNLPKFEAAIEAARMARETYETELRAAGRIF